MKKLLFILALFLTFSGYSQNSWFDLFRADIFVDNINGSDSNPGTWLKPVATIAEANSIAESGDRIALKAGQTWRESCTVPYDNMTYRKYGTGANPVIDGADVIDVNPVYKDSIIWSQELDADLSNSTYYNWRQAIPAVNGSGSQIRITIEGYSVSGGSKLAGISIGKRVGLTDDFRDNPVRITFSNNDTVDVGENVKLKSDWIDYDVEKDSLYLVHFYMSTATGVARTSVTGQLYRSTSTDDNTLTKVVDYGVPLTSVRIITAIEIRGDVVPNLWEKSGVTVEPNMMYLNDTIRKEEISVADCDTVGQWYWDSGTKVFSVYSTTDPSGDIKLGQRSNLIQLGSNDYITLKNINVQYSNGIAGVSGADLNNIVIEGCTVQRNRSHGISITNVSDLVINKNTLQNNGGEGLANRNTWVRSNVPGNRNITFSNNVCNNASEHGFYLQSTLKANATKNVTISGNTFNNNIGAGLYVSKLDTAVIFNNYFDSNGNLADVAEDYSIGITSCDNLDVYNNTLLNTLNNDAIQLYSDSTFTYGSADNVRIFNNYIYGVTNGDGIAIGTHNANTCTNALIAYNLIGETEQNGINLTSYGEPTSSINVLNNTIYKSSWFGLWASELFPVILKNNIFADGATTCVRHIGATGLTTSNNLYYRPGGGKVLDMNSGSVYYTDLDITTFEPTAQTGDPLFTNAGTGDFTLQSGSPAINAGVDVGLTTDILGNPIVGNPDIGAYEKQ